MPSTLLFTLADTGPWVILRSNAEKIIKKCASVFLLSEIFYYFATDLNYLFHLY